MSPESPKKCFYLFILFISFINLVAVTYAQAPDLCGENKNFDLSPLHYGSPWRVSKIFKSIKHTIDILPCQNFNSLKDSNIPENCKNSSICHKISNTTSPSQVKFIGYVPLEVVEEYKTYRARYVGPQCADRINYTVDIRFVCGNNLGYPSYPNWSIINNCSTILHWETSAACKNLPSKSGSFGFNERPCYIIDNNDRRRDLTPLIRPNGGYKVWSSDSKEFYINICTDVSNSKCVSTSGVSACIRNEQGIFESTGSYKWSTIEFKPANELVKYDHIELSYKAKNSRCNNPFSASFMNESTTIIRFICPKDLDSPRRYPVLVSSLDCRYEIEWITNFACPQEEITTKDVDCKIDNVDFNQFKTEKFLEFKDKKPDGTNISILLNVCGSVASDNCSKDSSVCIASNKTDGKTSFLDMSRKNANFIKADNLISLLYTSRKASCADGKYDRTIVEFECDQSVDLGKPDLIDIEECKVLFKWRTKAVCPLLMPALNCTFESENGSIQIDLSSLTLGNASFYNVQGHLYDPKHYYMLSPKKQILLNICGNLPLVNNTVDCSHSSACLVEDKNTSISLGHFTQPLTYNKELNAFQLFYTDGFDPRTNRTLKTLINFYCTSWSQDNQPYLVDYDQTNGQYTIEFNTPAACPLQTIQGNDCTVIDPLTSNVFSLKSLAAEHYYTVKSGSYQFELNVCQPIKNGSCGDNVAICQKEQTGDKRSFSLGKATSSLSYWNTILNMTFVGGTPYNDPKKTQRKSHITFICDPKAGTGFPEFDGEKDRSYFFRWYTSVACPGPVSKVTHCVFENETHFFDLSPLSLEQGNHFELGQSESIVYINFCRPLNKIRDNLLANCKSNSGICLIKSFKSGTHLSLGEPVGHPFQGFDGKIYLLYNNGDECPHNKSQSITSRVRLECASDLAEDLSITFLDNLSSEGNPCSYEFIVQTPLACPRPLKDLTLDSRCIYTDKRTNLSADLSQLTRTGGDYQIIGNQGKQSSFSLNVCKPVTQSGDQCKDSAVCYQSPKNELIDYGNFNEAKLYFESNNLHVRYAGGSVCESYDQRKRSADIEFICDHTAHSSQPTLYFQNDCLAKFRWHTSAVCNLIVPSCSLIDDSTGDYYSLRQLASMSHVWNVSTTFGDEHYIINVCKALPIDHNCGSSSAACKCKLKDGHFDCNTSIGKVSDHEFTLDPTNKDLILLYEDGEQICDGSAAQTQIRFQCSKDNGHSGPELVKIKHCTHYFTWKTIFACSQRNINNSSTELSINENLIVQDQNFNLKWDLHSLFNTTFYVSESERLSENYTYVFNFQNQQPLKTGNCANAAICQTKPKETFSRDIGTLNNWKFTFVGSDLYMIIHSNNSICGRSKQKNVTSKIRFECAQSSGIGHPQFLFESQDCDYYFSWQTSLACEMMEFEPTPAQPITKPSGMSSGWILFSLFIFAVFGFAGWLFVSGSSARDDVVHHIRKVFRRTETPQMPFRYQQLSH